MRKQWEKKIVEPPQKLSRMEGNNENTQERFSESHKDEVVLLTDPDSE